MYILFGVTPFYQQKYYPCLVFTVNFEFFITVIKNNYCTYWSTVISNISVIICMLILFT